jgi:mannose/cellobiose epimerase-like protein (N-acyl-D-glucosamine 2-epimerase family)
MHTVEAFLAAADVTGDRLWRDRALRIAERFVHEPARGRDRRMPEHFDGHWNVLLDYHRDEPAHPFRPYGVTIGHLMEWARLALHLRTASGVAAPDWLRSDARALFDHAVREGWHADGAEGFVYTTDFAGKPVVRDRLHWVVCEGIAAAWSLSAATGEAAYGEWYQRLWRHAREYFIDTDDGSWHHELDQRNTPASSVWQGKPDLYHAYQATLLPRLGEITSFASALAGGTR